MIISSEPTTDAEPATSPTPNPERWVDEHGDFLFNYALVRLRSRTRAEDFVQETFLSALRSQSQFAGRGAERSWLTGILRHKIMDHYRTADREKSFTDLDFYGDEESRSFVADGLRQGAWLNQLGPVDWAPKLGESLDHEEFWKAFHSCTDKLPINVARIFMLREMDEVSTHEICETMNISPNNLGVILHRARMALRRCLETNWFGK